ncbi:MAG: lipopolysaccharide export system protein LptA [Rubritalea sp.]|jgi:lipopolysaccharide export system protein LptA
MYPKLIVILLSSSVIFADDLSKRADESIKKTKQRMPALELLPSGSILKKISIPRYNKDYTPSSLLTADQLEVISEEEIQGTHVGISFYDAKGNIKRCSVLNSVNYNQATGLLTSKENLTFSGGTFTASSQGLTLDWENQRGFLLGKNQTLIYIKQSILMKNSNPQPLKASSKAKSLATTAAVAVIASSPSFLSAQDLAQIDQVSKPSTELLIQQLDQTKASLAATVVAEAKIATIRKELTEKLGAVPPIDITQPVPLELLPTKGKQFIRITSDQLLFDAKKGIFVYYGNVRITHPKYTFSCDGELKIILSEAATSKKLKPEERAKLKPNDLFDDVSQVIATKNVIVQGKDNKGRPVNAVTQNLTFTKTTGDIILKGKGSRITTADGQLKVVTNNGYLKLDQNFNASGQGTNTVLSVPEKKSAPKKK